MRNVQSISEMPFVADNPALDFVNTAEERGHPDADDALLSPSDLRLWGQRYGLLAGSLKLGDDAAVMPYVTHANVARPARTAPPASTLLSTTPS